MKQTNKEYIERKTALNLLYDLYTNFDPSYDHGIGRSISTIKDMTAAEVRSVVQGRWIEHNDEIMGLTYECSVCHAEGMIYGKFCPNCGAEMKRDKDE